MPRTSNRSRAARWHGTIRHTEGYDHLQAALARMASGSSSFEVTEAQARMALATVA